MRNVKKGDGSIFPALDSRKIEPSPFFQLARGFTLIELILVVTVIITLALIAIPNYNKSKDRAIEKEGISNVRLIAAAERIYKMESSANVYVACANATTCNTALNLNLNATNWSYKVELASGSGVATITATGSAVSGCSYTLTSANFDAEPTVPAGSSCP
ncbi:MAG: type II secretion system protein [Candidatus Omnitrophota bacterium]|nr:type II secretion system protein [Candidatus Omnitrophota bacterium]